MKCDLCLGTGTYKDYDPLGYTYVHCVHCEGSGLSEESRIILKSEIACDDAWEKNSENRG